MSRIARTFQRVRRWTLAGRGVISGAGAAPGHEEFPASPLLPAGTARSSATVRRIGDANLTSLCVFCHLHGVHEGRIAAEPPASRIHWRIGREGTLRVEGRTRTAA